MAARRRSNRRVSSYGHSPVTAGISNFPLLLQGGALTDLPRLDPSQMIRASRGAIAVDSTFVYLAIVDAASVPEIALVLQALGGRARRAEPRRRPAATRWNATAPSSARADNAERTARPQEAGGGGGFLMRRLALLCASLLWLALPYGTAA